MPQPSESKGMSEERDLAHEADMQALMRQQLRDNISAEEAAEECAEIDARNAWMEGADLDDGDDGMGDPDEYDFDDDELSDAQVRDQDSLFGCLPTAPEEKM